MVMQGSANGVIMLKVMYCDPFDLEYPYLIERLSAKSIPYLGLTTGFETESTESIRTRLQAFAEMIKGT
jgi:benzoyl-CoA reductase/2-hydroxyglutaryl-CoA dehydratase subunit BcrC/BadD/HgdB